MCFTYFYFYFMLMWCGLATLSVNKADADTINAQESGKTRLEYWHTKIHLCLTNIFCHIKSEKKKWKKKGGKMYHLTSEFFHGHSCHVDNEQ